MFKIDIVILHARHNAYGEGVFRGNDGTAVLVCIVSAERLVGLIEIENDHFSCGNP